MADPLVDRAAEAFAAELARRRVERGFSQKQLARHMGFDPSYVSHVEARRHRPTEDFARKAEAVLQAGGAIWRRFLEYDQARQRSSASGGHRLGREHPERRFPATAGLIVEHERSRLRFANGSYHCVIQRDLYNAGTEPVTRFLVRISVDRYPTEPERSNRHYREHPLTWTELNLTARCGEEIMLWRPKQDRDAFKEVWLLFENDLSRFPLYPGHRATIEYSYVVGEDKWGHWFQRAIRLPTRKLTVELDFPTELGPVASGVEISLSADAGPLPTPMTRRRRGERTVFHWSIDGPPLNNRYRIEWRFRADPPTPSLPAKPAAVRLSALMRAAGVVQRGASILERPARWFDLPAQRDLAEDVAARLLEALDRVSRSYEFTKGVGLAAPQIGLSWAAAVVKPPGKASTPFVMLNPRVVAESVDRDEQYEGCLSFFDVRGLVSRPLLVEVEHERMDGTRITTTFTEGMARLVAHEVDHLAGLLYCDRMPTDGRLVAIEDYPEQGKPWRY